MIYFNTQKFTAVQEELRPKKNRVLLSSWVKWGKASFMTEKIIKTPKAEKEQQGRVPQKLSCGNGWAITPKGRIKLSGSEQILDNNTSI